MIRPEALATLSRWRELAFASVILLLGLWTMTRGGPILAGLGATLGILGAGLAITAFRRLRFAQAVASPGIVEVIEGEVRYFGPTLGGAISLADLVELRLLTLRGRRMWRLKQIDGQALLVPVDAAGAETLFDAFTALPGMDMTAALSALSPTPSPTPSPTRTGPGILPAHQPDMILVWHKKGGGLVA